MGTYTQGPGETGALSVRFGLRDRDAEARARLLELLRAARREVFLTTAEVALLLAVTPATVRRWADEGKLASVRSLGGHRRYPASAVRGLLGAAGS